MIKRLFLDVETTDVEITSSFVIQIGLGIRYGSISEDYELFCKPIDPDYTLAEEAVEKHGFTRKIIDTFPESVETYNRLTKILSKHINKYDKTDKFVVYGYAVEFDNQMLRKFFLEHGDNYFGAFFWHPFVDIMSLAMYGITEIDQRHRLENFKQSTVAQYLGIDVDEIKLHGAGYDIHLTESILETITHGKVGKKSTHSVVNERLERAFRRRKKKYDMGQDDDIPF